MLIDDLRRNPKLMTAPVKSVFHGLDQPMFHELIQDAVVIDATNVAQMVYEDKRSDTGWDMVNDFPTIAPPAPLTWIECKPPANVFPDCLMVKHVRRWGCFILAMDRENPAHKFLWAHDYNEYLWKEIRFKNMEATRWILLIQLITENKDGDVIPQFEWYFPVGEDGKHASYGTPMGYGNYAKIHSLKGYMDEKQIFEHEAVMTPFLTPILMTFALLHCKNVVKHTTEPPAKLNKKMTKRYGVPMAKHWTLDIRPMREVLRHEGKSESLGLHKALHICRGHFRTYDEKPLFGKVKGTFYVPMHLKGNAEHGVVQKEYKVETT